MGQSATHVAISAKPTFACVAKTVIPARSYREKAEHMRLDPAIASSPATTPPSHLRRRLYPAMKQDTAKGRSVACTIQKPQTDANRSCSEMIGTYLRIVFLQTLSAKSMFTVTSHLRAVCPGVPGRAKRSSQNATHRRATQRPQQHPDLKPDREEGQNNPR